MRAFLAIDLPEDVIEALTRLQRLLPVGRPVPTGNLHLTLSFLGDQPEELLQELHFTLETLRAAPFELRLSGLGCFGGRRPRVLFADVAPSEPLMRLQGQVAAAVRRSGIRLPREHYHPHVTLARFGNGAGPRDAARIGDFIADFGSVVLPRFTVTGFALYRSTLHRQAARHEELARYDLV